MDRFRAGRARGRRIVVGMDALVPVTNVFRELSQRRCRVSEREDPFGIFRIVLKYLIKILPFVLPKPFRLKPFAVLAQGPFTLFSGLSRDPTASSVRE